MEATCSGDPGWDWYIKLRSPTGRVEKSLGTSDYREADAKAGPLIAAHKAALLAARPRVETTWEREYEPGLHTGLNGERIYATPTEFTISTKLLSGSSLTA